MSPRVPRLRWDDPFRALDMLASLWSSTGMSLVSAGAAQAVAAPYRTLFTTLQQLLIGKEVTVRIGDHDVVLTVTELDSALEPQGLAVGQLGEVRVAARGISWDQHHLHSAVAVLRNVHIRPGVPPLVIAAPVELSSALPTEIFDDVLRQATPQLRGELSESGAARLRWARRPDWGGLEVDVDVAGTTSQTTLWLRPRTVITGQRRGHCRHGHRPTECHCLSCRMGCASPTSASQPIVCSSLRCFRSGERSCRCVIWKA
ncbi:hypothetical protein AL79_03178 [Mycobacterium tuberculosis TKK_03_0156]|nr:hypothetical protein AL25_03165 [Mycobacterium tuberculosis TKK_03_0047]KAR98175.1 hypothetical protein AL35_03370 [Mycobacterium tuberculosis TKK_03_0072]KAS10451.1 hypothetical protein AL42_03372 [Mycobacterium tuberculosis TKK_03_0083]KAT14629.1 hypothetical protein AL79_03178 [Mycobacterium tuberculosis TKK_03_0156]CFQ69821.1 Conserved exported protein of uncharacterised function [Mycobacterium tuberculosis]